MHILHDCADCTNRTTRENVRPFFCFSFLSARAMRRCKMCSSFFSGPLGKVKGPRRTSPCSHECVAHIRHNYRPNGNPLPGVLGAFFSIRVFRIIDCISLGSDLEKRRIDSRIHERKNWWRSKLIKLFKNQKKKDSIELLEFPDTQKGNSNLWMKILLNTKPNRRV